MTLNIRVGGRYMTRGGEVAEIIGEVPMTSYRRCGLIDDAQHFWTDDGRYYIGEPSELDLVSEITEPTAGERLVRAAKEAVAIARGEAHPAAVHTSIVSGGVAERIRSGCPDTVGDEFFAMTVEWPHSLMGKTFRIEHDGFEGEVIGSYYTREGKRGVVLQQTGTRVVHVYGEKWLKLADAGDGGEEA